MISGLPFPFFLALVSGTKSTESHAYFILVTVYLLRPDSIKLGSTTLPDSIKLGSTTLPDSIKLGSTTL